MGLSLSVRISKKLRYPIEVFYSKLISWTAPLWCVLARASGFNTVV